MEREAADAQHARLHHARPWHNGDGTVWVAEPSLLHPYKFDMGVTIGVAETDLRPDDKFLTRESWAPEVPIDPADEIYEDEED